MSQTSRQDTNTRIEIDHEPCVICDRGFTEEEELEAHFFNDGAEVVHAHAECCPKCNKSRAVIQAKDMDEDEEARRRFERFFRSEGPVADGFWTKDPLYQQEDE